MFLVLLSVLLLLFSLSLSHFLSHFIFGFMNRCSVSFLFMDVVLCFVELKHEAILLLDWFMLIAYISKSLAILSRSASHFLDAYSVCTIFSTPLPIHIHSLAAWLVWLQLMPVFDWWTHLTLDFFLLWQWEKRLDFLHSYLVLKVNRMEHMCFEVFQLEKSLFQLWLLWRYFMGNRYGKHFDDSIDTLGLHNGAGDDDDQTG